MSASMPVALRAWEPELHALSEALVSAIAPWLGPLSAAIGPLGRDRSSPLGEPDGFASLSRRGSYERLLASEWALAEEAPDEFLRRAAGGEHLFLALARRAPTAHERTIVLFDAGPWQLGTPRLAHVALAIVLARRAREAHASFAWGVLQRPDDELREGLDARALLEARVPNDVGSDAIDAWAARLSEADATDAWVIAAPRTSAALAARGLHAVGIETPCELEPAPLRLRVDARRRGPLSLELPLPSADDCVRAMREIKDAARSAPRGAHGIRLFWLSREGDRVFAITSDNLLSWPLPPSARATAPRARKLPIDGTLLAVASMGKQVLALARVDRGSGSEIVALGSSHFAGDVRISPSSLSHHVRGAGLVPAWISIRAPRITMLVDGVLCDASHDLRPLADGIIAVVPEPAAILVVRRAEDGSLEAARVLRRAFDPAQPFDAENQGPLRITELESDASRVSRVLVARVDQTTRFGLETAPHVWSVMAADATNRRTLHGPDGTTVVALGVTMQGEIGLVLLERDARTFTLLAPSGARPIATACAAVVDTSTCDYGRTLAWRTESGWIEVASILKAEIVLRLPLTEEQAP